MKLSIKNKLETLKERYEELELLLGNSRIISDKNQFRLLLKEYMQLTDIISCFVNWKQVKNNILIAEQMLEDHDIRDIAQDELKSCRIEKEILEKRLECLLLPTELDDKRGCFIEIRAGTGGNEAAIFAGELFRIYTRYSEIRCWKMKIVSFTCGEHGGYKEIIGRVSNDNAYHTFKFESGGHRVQRIPETESQGRVHTSTCTVAVIPEIQEAEFPKININDLRIHTFRSSGAGGQHVNTTDSAIRITHLPSGLVVECQDERSQHKNKAKALSVLGARLRAAETQKRQKETSSTRRNLLGSGDRSDRIRTYNFPQGRVTDHRINLTLYRLDEVMEGKLDMLIQPIMQEHQADQLSVFSENIL